MSPSQNKSAMQDHIPQWQASSLTQVEYCKAHDIKPHIFSYYKKQFSSATSSAVSPGRDDSLQKAQGCCQSEVRDSARGRLKFYPE